MELSRPTTQGKPDRTQDPIPSHPLSPRRPAQGACKTGRIQCGMDWCVYLIFQRERRKNATWGVWGVHV